MESIEQIGDRLKNLRSIEPILTALRTISLSTLQGALRRLESARAYQDQLHELRRLALLWTPPTLARSDRKVAGSDRRRHLALLIVTFHRLKAIQIADLIDNDRLFLLFRFDQ